MKGTDTGKDKVKKICDILRKETLEPAQLEADAIIETAKAKAEEILLEAEKTIERMQKEARLEIERDRTIFQSSIQQACKQALEMMKQKIEQKLFNPELHALISKGMQEPKVIAELISAVVKAIEKEGIDSDLSVYISAAIPAESVNLLLAQRILDRLKEKGVLISTLTGGIEVKLHKENMTVDISDAAIAEIVSHYIRKDFRELFFRG